MPIVMGIGLAALSGGALAGSRGRGEESRWRDHLFVFAALLVGLTIFGAALYVLGWSIESGRRLGPADARTENWLIFAMALLLMAMAARAAWTGYFYSSEGSPWERGHFDRLPQLVGFMLASVGVVVVGSIIDLTVIAVARLKAGPALFVIGATLALGLALACALLRLMSGGNPSPRAFMMSRRTQLRMLSKLDGASGSWTSVEVRAIAELEPPLALSATIWRTQRGMYWRGDDAYALARYHDWAANHAVLPTFALHTQRLTVFAGPSPPAMRGMRLTPVSGRRLWWMDAWRTHRLNGPSPADASPRERAAGLVHVPHEQLRAAGLLVSERRRPHDRT